MMLDVMPYFVAELGHIADGLFKTARAKTPKLKARAEAQRHFDSEDPDWKRFEKNLRLKTFQQVVGSDPRADDKLKRYIENYGSYLLSRQTTAKVPGDSGRTYTVKELPGGRLGCNCKNWQYRRSVDGGDCKHIEKLVSTKFAMQVKQAFVSGLATMAGSTMGNLGANKLRATRAKRRADLSVATTNLYAEQAREHAMNKYMKGS